jgi:hypothetical protein
MVGLPDGLGAFDNGDGTFTVLMNHELASDQGIAHDHGGAGAFVSKWVIEKSTLTVLSGADLIQTVHLWDGNRYRIADSVAFSHFCSGDLPVRGALVDSVTGDGYDGMIYLNGEEAIGGRAFGHVVETGASYELPAFGLGRWENVVANPSGGASTVVAATNDVEGGPLHIYVGHKRSTGNPVERAGLTGGRDYVVSVAGFPAENPNDPWAGTTRFSLSPDPGVATGWARPEDSSWDAAHPNDLYFVTTASFAEPSRLWRLRFDDVTDPTAGGTVTLVLQGAAGADAGPNMMDNLTVTDGQVMVQEDPGSNPYLSGIFQVDARTGAFRRIAQHDPARFVPGSALFDTVDEESSGIIPVPFLGAGMYLLDVQDHAPAGDAQIVQRGQLLLMHAPSLAG